MFVTLVPFSTSLMNDYPSDRVADVFFGLNLFFLGILFYLGWAYATDNYRLMDKKSANLEHINRAKRSLLITPLVAILAICISFVTPYSSLTYLLIPIIVWRMKK
jgi:uncharacterized membrane protein